MKQRYPGWDNREYEDRMTYMRTILEPLIKLDAAAQEVVDQRGKHHAFPHKALEKLRWQLRAADARREEVVHNPSDHNLNKLRQAVRTAQKTGDVVLRAAMRAR